MLKSLFLVLFSIPVFCYSQIHMIELEVKTVPEPSTRDSTVDQWNLSQTEYSRLSSQSKQVLYWVNYCRSNPAKFWDSVIVPVLSAFPSLKTPESTSLRSDLIKTGVLPMFRLNKTLVKTAQDHAIDIASKKALPGHLSTNGDGFDLRLKRAGIKYCASENISLTNQSILLSVVLLYLDIGLPELGHRKSLLSDNLREIGIGAALYGEDQYFLVQDLACAQ